MKLNKAIGSPWNCLRPQCCGGAIACSGAAKVYLMMGSLLEGNRSLAAHPFIIAFLALLF
jgi:hypothetical protein